MNTDPESPQVIANVVSEFEAEAIVAALEASGIKAMSVGAPISDFRAEVQTDVGIVVRQADVERAKEVLAEIQGESTPPDDSQA